MISIDIFSYRHTCLENTFDLQTPNISDRISENMNNLCKLCRKRKVMVLKITNAFAFWSCATKNGEPVDLSYFKIQLHIYPEYIGLKGYIERKNKTEYFTSTASETAD